MSADDGNKTVFKPSPLSGLKSGATPPPPKTTPGRPTSQAAPGPVAEPARRAEEPTLRQASIPPVGPAPATPAPAAAVPAKRKRAGRNASFWFFLAVGAALGIVILYILFNLLGLA